MATSDFSYMGCMLDSEVAWNILVWMASTQARATSMARTAAQALSAFAAIIEAAAAAVSAAAAALSAATNDLLADEATLNADAAALSV